MRCIYPSKHTFPWPRMHCNHVALQDLSVRKVATLRVHGPSTSMTWTVLAVRRVCGSVPTMGSRDTHASIGKMPLWYAKVYVCLCTLCSAYISLNDAHSVAYCVCPWDYVKFYMTCNKLDDTYSDKMHPDKELWPKELNIDPLKSCSWWLLLKNVGQRDDSSA